MYGIGSNFKISDSVIANIEFNRQTARLDQGSGAGLKDYKISIHNLKFGIAYNF